MRPVHRWGLAAVATVLVVLTPYAGRALPTHDPDVATTDLVARVRQSADTPYSGTVDVRGRVGLPIADHFTDLADLFGSDTRLRVWWHSDVAWRVDRLLDTGEVDLFHLGHITTEWSYERREAETYRDPEIRLPRDSDLLPPQVARMALDGQSTRDVTRLPPRRVAGVDAAGFRVSIAAEQSTLRHVDLWVDPTNGVTLAADVYADGDQPLLSTTFTTYSRTTPDLEVTQFRPAAGVHRYSYRVLDIANAADQFASVRPPARVAGLHRTAGRSAAIYGSGLTRLLALPLPPSEADRLAYRLSMQGARSVHGQPLLRVGPLGAVVSRGTSSLRVRWLVTGTVTDQALLDAAADLDAWAVLG